MSNVFDQLWLWLTGEGAERRRVFSRHVTISENVRVYWLRLDQESRIEFAELLLRLDANPVHPETSPLRDRPGLRSVPFQRSTVLYILDPARNGVRVFWCE